MNDIGESPEHQADGEVSPEDTPQQPTGRLHLPRRYGQGNSTSLSSSSLGLGSYGLWSPTGDAAVTTIGSGGQAITVVSAATGHPAVTTAGSLVPDSWAPDGSGGFTLDGNPPDLVVRLFTVR